MSIEYCEFTVMLIVCVLCFCNCSFVSRVVCVLCRRLKFPAERHYPCGYRQVIGIELVKVRYHIAV